MKILIVTAGTRGDVQPYVALGRGLVKAGHEITIATDAIFASFIREHGLNFFPLGINPQKAMQEDVSRIGANPVKFLSWLNRNMKPMLRQGFIDLKEACSLADAVIYSALMFIAPHVAEGAGIPSLPAFLLPSSPTRAFPAPTASGFPSWLPFRGRANWLSFRLSNQTIFLMTRGTINQCRLELLDLPALPWRFFSSLDISDYPVLYGYSQQVVPRPADWGAWLHVCGYWFLEGSKAFEPPAELLRFLNSGSPPVYLGFGSMVDREAASFTRLVVEAISQAGVRAVLLGGWSNLGAEGLPEHILRVDSVPHDWLFPRMAAIVQHGGAGTTAASLRAGIPIVTVPFFGDQHFWGQRVYELGAGPLPIPRQKLTADRLTAAIGLAISDEKMKQRAADLGRRIQAEDGIGQAVSLVERYLVSSPNLTPMIDRFK